MGLGIDDVLEAAAVPAVLGGIGLAVAAPLLLSGSRPAAKRMLHAYLDFADKVKESGAETKEQWADLLAEVQAERRARAAEAGPAATDAQAAAEGQA